MYTYEATAYAMGSRVKTVRYQAPGDLSAERVATERLGNIRRGGPGTAGPGTATAVIGVKVVR